MSGIKSTGRVIRSAPVSGVRRHVREREEVPRQAPPPPERPDAEAFGDTAQRPPEVRDERADEISRLQAEIEQLNQRLAESATLADEAYREQKEAGYAAGLEIARGEAHTALDETRSELATLLGGLRRALDREILETERLAAEIAFAAVCRLMGEQLASPEGVQAVVRQVLQQARAQGHRDVQVLVSERDYLTLKKAGALEVMAGEGETLTIAPDARVTTGGCLIEDASGSWDGRLETQLQRLAETLGTAIYPS